LADLLPTLFFLNKKLHKRLKIVRSENTVVAFCYPDEENKHYFYSNVVREYQKAYTLTETSKMLGRPAIEIQKFLKNKLIDRPSGMEYQISSRRPIRLMWSQDDILDLRDRIYELFPKQKDGFARSNLKIASQAELLEEMQHGNSYHVLNSDGERVKVWRAL
jgi:hypothetical protein